MTSTAAVESVTCQECRRENEVERIYCHHCGARLERRKLSNAAPKEEDTQKRVKRLFDPNRAKLRLLFFRISKIALGSAAAAALILMATPPEIPPAPKGVLAMAPSINFDIERAASHHQPEQLRYSEQDVNAYLGSSLKSKRKQLDEPLLEFKRALIAFDEGSGAVTMERALFGYSLFTTLQFGAQNAAGKAGLTAKGASIGRLPVHPQVAKYMTYLFADLWGALERERKLGAKLSGVEFHDKAVVLSTGS